MPLDRNLQTREWLLKKLYAEIVGPDPAKDGVVLQFNDSGVANVEKEHLYKAKRQASGDEILWQDSPTKRYGAGVLFPQEVVDQLEITVDETAEVDADSQVDREIENTDASNIALEGDDAKLDAANLPKIGGIEESEEFDVTLANSYKPSAMGVSFLADLADRTDVLEIQPAFSIYEKKKVVSDFGDKVVERIVWVRKEISFRGSHDHTVRIGFEEIASANGPLKTWIKGQENSLEIVLFPRQVKESSNHRLITVSIVNRNQRSSRSFDEQCYFQVSFDLKSQASSDFILKYPEVLKENRLPGDEDEISRLLYRDKVTFAIGHGCAADWSGNKNAAEKLWTCALPTFETPSISADLTDEQGNSLRVSMRKLAGLDPDDRGTDELRNLILAYERWVKSLENFEDRKTYFGEITSVPVDLRDTAKLLIDRCGFCLERINKGLAFLDSDSEEAAWARTAFELTNHAMLISQLRSSRNVRNPIWVDGRLDWDVSINSSDPSIEHPFRGYWRPFQITFLLMTLRGVCLDEIDERDYVDLIWFPTGGGKTEAYLALTAFTIFYNRVSGKSVSGADVIMRYTLRLLTTQQFQRAALLFCSMEHLRNKPEFSDLLGDKPFRLGMWVGGEASPNTRSQAKSALGQLTKNPDAPNPFVLLKCPWCNAKFGPRDRSQRGGPSIYGYHKWRGATGVETVAFRCDDHNCEFGRTPLEPNRRPLPVTIIDEDIMEEPPSMVIGTVDKFALLAWKPEIRKLFGINEEGARIGKPPTLIIQDELHLISGPLGSMVGAYETIIEELCSYSKNKVCIKPKIVASTATISRAEDQVRSLYARDNMMLFPPSGLEANDSFFARESRAADGTLSPGRMYVGLMCTAHGSLQTTQARVFATLLQYPAILQAAAESQSDVDPWWTLLSFFNSIRELGGAASLMVADTRDYLRVIIDRHGYPYSIIRKLFHVIELTSRIRSDHIPLAIKQLEKSLDLDSKGKINDSVEVCLASNIIEVGVDIDRLSLLSIVGQPKTTSQYIQVSSRVGRNPEAPGLDVILFSQSKPRDRSHYESFKTYHQKLYSQVEPTSVTPFSPPAVDRALPGLIVSAVRQFADFKVATAARPFPLAEGSKLRQRVEDMICDRVNVVDPSETDNVKRSLAQRLKEWEVWDPINYGQFGIPPEHPPLMYPAGSRLPESWNGHSWQIMTSLRNVDASCEADITSDYNLVDAEGI